MESKYGSVPNNGAGAAPNSSEPIAPGQKLAPAMTKMVQEGNVKVSSMKARD